MPITPATHSAIAVAISATSFFGKPLPSHSELFSIYEYFEITPIEFFDREHSNPELLAKALSEIKSLNDDDLLITITLISR